MKIIHVPFCFYPDAVGGTEVYVEGLSRALQARGVEIVVAAPAETEKSYLHEGIRVRRFPVSKGEKDLRVLYGGGDADAARAFGRLLEEEHPQILHLHAFTPGISVSIVRQAKQRGIRVVFTYHTPTASCQRGTLMRWGREVCDGKLRAGLCARCTLQGLGVPRSAAEVAGRLPVFVGGLLGAAKLSGGIWTALRMRQLITLRHDAFRSLLRDVDQVVAVSAWVRSLLLLNGVSPEKLVLSRQGLPGEEVSDAGAPPNSTGASGRRVRIAFLGRMDPTKGAHVLVRALRSAPDLPVELDLYGVVQGTTDGAYRQRLHTLAAGDGRIHIRDPVPAGQVISLLRGYDLLAVPSQWMETGPMVVLEAFAAGVPVIGSDLGGIAELVREGTDGVLVRHDSEEEWTRQLKRICREREILARLRLGVSPPRSMSETASDMMAIYGRLARGSAAT